MTVNATGLPRRICSGIGLMATSTATAIVPTTSTSQSVRPYSQTYSSTPQRTPQNAASSTLSRPVVPSPGRFRHPRMEEIAKRREASSFSVRNIQIVLLNTAVLIVTVMARDTIYSGLSVVSQVVPLEKAALCASLIINLTRLILVSNIYFALRPILPHVSKNDGLEDIPLTPSQRALMGLPPSQTNTPQTGGKEDYITPPRYRRSSPSPFTGTPQPNGTGNRSISANYSASPLSTSRHAVGFSPTPQQATGTPLRRLSGSPFSPSSPLFSRAFLSPSQRNDVVPNADFTESTRSLLAGHTSTNSLQSTFRRSQSVRERGRPQSQEPGTPSPGGREKRKVDIQPGLNYKWLYEKGAKKIGKNGQAEY